MPLAISALGRAYLSALDAPARSALLRQAGARRSIERPLRAATMHGYCVSVREWHPEIGAVATAIQAPDGAILALNCGGPVFRFDDQYLRRRVAPHLLEAARATSKLSSMRFIGRMKRSSACAMKAAPWSSSHGRRGCALR